jgi:hypothetical protein
MFRHRGAIIRGPLLDGNVGTTHQSSYYVAFTEIIKMLGIKILKYMRLIATNLHCCNINSTKSIKSKPFQVLQFAPVWMMHTDIYTGRT